MWELLLNYIIYTFPTAFCLIFHPYIMELTSLIQFIQNICKTFLPQNLRVILHLWLLLCVGERFAEIIGKAYYMAREVLKRNYGLEIDIWGHELYFTYFFLVCHHFRHLLAFLDWRGCMLWGNYRSPYKLIWCCAETEHIYKTNPWSMSSLSGATLLVRPQAEESFLR